MRNININNISILPKFVLFFEAWLSGASMKSFQCRFGMVQIYEIIMLIGFDNKSLGFTQGYIDLPFLGKRRNSHILHGYSMEFWEIWKHLYIMNSNLLHSTGNLPRAFPPVSRLWHLAWREFFRWSWLSKRGIITYNIFSYPDFRKRLKKYRNLSALMNFFYATLDSIIKKTQLLNYLPQ